MSVSVHQLMPEQWKIFSENAHAVAFGKIKDVSKERIDYALIARWEESQELIGYVTVKEMDADSVYWQFGGALPPGRGTVRVWAGYQAFLEWTSQRYKRMTTLIENTNVPMLKMALHARLRITGVRNYKGEVLLEHGIEFGS